MLTEINQPAKIIAEITGDRIETILVGTEFIITWTDLDRQGDGGCYSSCAGLGVTSVFNDEFTLI